MTCWICGEEANTGEHLIKASDLKALFGRVTNRSPLYFHTSVVRNRTIAGINSDKLKYSKRICSCCNNERTQADDRAWEYLSKYLRSKKYGTGTLVRLDRAFPGKVRQSMLEVHLFFVKLFGCLIAEHSIPLNIQPFADAILQRKAHPKVHLSFWTCLENPIVKEAGRTPVHTTSLDGNIVFATWFYIVDNISVNVVYAEPTEHRRGPGHSWHPTKIGKRIHIGRT
jgi:hypothetical protein